MAKRDLALLCDAAQISAEGKLYLIGGLVSTVMPPQLPAIVQLSLVMQLELETDDVGANVMSVRVRYEADGELLVELTIPGTVEYPVNFDPDLPMMINAVIPLVFEVRRPGLYRVELLFNGDQLISLPYKVKPQLPSM